MKTHSRLHRVTTFIVRNASIGSSLCNRGYPVQIVVESFFATSSRHIQAQKKTSCYRYELLDVFLILLCKDNFEHKEESLRNYE